MVGISDRSAGDGEAVLTDLIYPAPASDGLALFADGGDAQLKRLSVWPLKSVWGQRARDD